MQTVTSDLVKGKTVLLRLDLDVPLIQKSVLRLRSGQEVGSRKSEEYHEMVVAEDYRLRVTMPTLRLCLDHAKEVIIMGHIGRPQGEDPNLSVAPIYQWFLEHGFRSDLESEKLRLLENLRFEEGENLASLEYARELANLGDPSTTLTELSTGSLGTGFFVNEAFAAHHQAASTTVLPTLLPHAAGLRFAKEVEKLTNFKKNPQKPFVAVIGGAKIEDKYEAIISLNKICDKVLVGGLLPKLIDEQQLNLPDNVFLGRLNEEGNDLSVVSLAVFLEIIEDANQVIWAGPVGKYEDPAGNHGNIILAHTIIDKNKKAIIGGGDTIAALAELGLLEQLDLSDRIFISVGGGAMLEFLSKGTLPTIEVLN